MAIRALVQASAYINETPNAPQDLGKLVSSYILEFELKGIGGGGASNLSTRLHQINGYETGQWGEGI